MDAKNKEGGKRTQNRDFENIPYSSFFTHGEPAPVYTTGTPGRRNMVFGALWILIGAGITWYLSEAAVQGQSYVLPVVAVVFGIVQLCKGIGQFFSHPDEW